MVRRVREGRNARTTSSRQRSKDSLAEIVLILTIRRLALSGVPALVDLLGVGFNLTEETSDKHLERRWVGVRMLRVMIDDGSNSLPQVASHSGAGGERDEAAIKGTSPRIIPQQLLEGLDAEALPSVGSVGVRGVHGLEEGQADGVVRTSIKQLTAAW